MTAIANASPKTRVAVELEVGARPKGSASVRTPISRCKSVCFAKVDSGFPVIEIVLAPIPLIGFNTSINSELFPLYETKIQTSSSPIIPKSP